VTCPVALYNAISPAGEPQDEESNVIGLMEVLRASSKKKSAAKSKAAPNQRMAGAGRKRAPRKTARK
jgi:non-homologous end joining protein Ku